MFHSLDGGQCGILLPQKIVPFDCSGLGFWEIKTATCGGARLICEGARLKQTYVLTKVNKKECYPICQNDADASF